MNVASLSPEMADDTAEAVTPPPDVITHDFSADDAGSDGAPLQRLPAQLLGHVLHFAGPAAALAHARRGRGYRFRPNFPESEPIPTATQMHHNFLQYT